MYKRYPVIEIRRKYRLRWVSFGLALLLAVPVIARETIVLQKSATDPQARGADATLSQANATTNNVGTTLTVSGVGGANDNAIVEFDLSRIPNVGIKAATLTLHVITPPSGTVTYDAFDVTNFWQSNVVTWNTRVATTPWTTAGGDFAGTATDTEMVKHNSTSVSFDITADVQNWYNGSTNYGTMIVDENTNHNRTTVFGSKEATTSTNAPELDVTFVQNVKGLTAAPGNASIALNWQIPALIGTPVGTETYTGVLILRRASSPVDKTSIPTDGSTPALCSTVGTGTVVFSDTSGKTSFTDDASDTCGAPANGTTYFYKVFLRDSSNFYSTQDITNGSTFAEEISATPAATTAAQQNTQWIAATFATDLASPALIPGNVAVVGSGINLLFMINANTGLRQFLPVSLGGAIASRSPVISAALSSTAQDIVYVTDQDGLIYGIFTDTGVIDWVVNPLNPASTGTLELQGGPAVQLKSITGGTNDQVFFGTRNTGTTTGNQIFALNGNTGVNATWSPITGATGSIPKLDIISSTPLVDYVHTALWVTSRSACGTAQPSLWKINPSTGVILATEDLGDMDASPTLTATSDVLFAANNGDAIVGGKCTAGNSTIYAIDPTTGATLATFPSTDGAVVSYPVVVGSAPTYNVIYSGATGVHLLQYDSVRKNFIQAWVAPITNPSAPIAVTGLAFVFVGSSDGTIHELALNTGVDVKNEVANSGPTIGTVGDPSIDEALSRIYVTTSDQRAYAFTIPF